MSWLDQVIGYGTHAARPAAGSAGRLYYETDTATLFRDNGTTWDSLTLGSGAPGVVKLGETIVGAGGQQTFTFSAIPAGYARLEIVIVGRSDGATSGSAILVQFNGDTTAANYKSLVNALDNYVTGGSFNIQSPTSTSAGASVGWLGGTDQTDLLDRCTMRLFIPDYTDTTHHKSVEQQGVMLASGDYEMGLNLAYWLSTAAITDIAVHMVTNKLVEGSTVRLYGVV